MEKVRIIEIKESIFADNNQEAVELNGFDAGSSNFLGIQRRVDVSLHHTNTQLTL